MPHKWRAIGDSGLFRGIAVAAVLCAGGLAGCGRAEESGPERDSSAANVESRARDGTQQVEPVSHGRLADLLVESHGGWGRVEQDGKLVELSHGRFTNVTATYTNPDHPSAHMYVSITDGCFVERMYEDYHVRRDTDVHGSEVRYTNLDVQGFPAVETVTEPAAHAEMNVLVAERFVVKVHSEQIDYETLRAFLTGLDLKRLAAFE